jgi:dihydrofolate synthase/folylpolyglutamate synthase
MATTRIMQDSGILPVVFAGIGYVTTLERLAAIEDAASVAPTAARRGWNAVWLRRWLRDRGRPPARALWTLLPDFGEALAKVQEGAGTVLVTGSFHTVGDVMTALGMEVV